jgi:hypothetical protein
VNPRLYGSISKLFFVFLLPISVSISNSMFQLEFKLMSVRSITDQFEALSIAISTKSNFSFLCWLLVRTQVDIIICTWMIVVTVIVGMMVFNSFLKKSYKVFIQFCSCFFFNQRVVPEFIVNDFISLLLFNDLIHDLGT